MTASEPNIRQKASVDAIRQSTNSACNLNRPFAVAVQVVIEIQLFNHEHVDAVAVTEIPITAGNVPGKVVHPIVSRLEPDPHPNICTDRSQVKTAGAWM